jgi:hypothetical protein
MMLGLSGHGCGRTVRRGAVCYFFLSCGSAAATGVRPQHHPHPEPPLLFFASGRTPLLRSPILECPPIPVTLLKLNVVPNPAKPYAVNEPQISPTCADQQI